MEMVFMTLQALIKLNLYKIIVGFNIFKGRETTKFSQIRMYIASVVLFLIH